MRILAVDDERIALELLLDAIRAACPDAEVGGFRDPGELLACARRAPVDVAFLDIQMRGMSGLALAKALKDIDPDVNVVFVTGYAQYTGEAIGLRASGYVMKPPTKEKIEAELQNLRRPVREERTEKRLRAQCFGNFEVFLDGRPLRFQKEKTKELLAYLVDRQGAAVNSAELCAVLWEDEPDTPALKTRLRKLCSDLRATLEQAGVGEVFLKERNSFAVDKTQLDCDFYRFLAGDVRAANAYHSEYMAQYSWAEMTLGGLESK